MWLQVSVDVFKGFPDEDSIVNYTLNQAYKDNVSVFASEFCEEFKSFELYMFFKAYTIANGITQ